jgi:hypothetical protein
VAAIDCEVGTSRVADHVCLTAGYKSALGG